jgi:hypothetical protein
MILEYESLIKFLIKVDAPDGQVDCIAIGHFSTILDTQKED